MGAVQWLYYEAYRLGGKAYDRVYMECLATEFQGRSESEP